MRGRSILLIIATWALIAVTVILAHRLNREPSYKGRTLQQWLKASPSEERQAHEAILLITSNSAPVLLQWLFADTTPPPLTNLHAR